VSEPDGAHGIKRPSVRSAVGCYEHGKHAMKSESGADDMRASEWFVCRWFTFLVEMYEDHFITVTDFL
jgi:hypothetical protein